MVAFLALTGWWPWSADTAIEFFERWVATTAMLYGLHALAFATIVAALERVVIEVDMPRVNVTFGRAKAGGE